ncbi:phenolphthiocerol synthesis polyketide synthase type I Pks15/1 domain protein [Mycobacterium ulcerans str. Harvey]|uniref:Phenolphthiocerol synthesis polyketide synthase type I Pks15/1 domain protein n=1 Tax=Mycobacterium ulcerans str. Harvey TaxID=1299332 RepID=A0ABN0QZ30_MYCUL|nr:phenolphthiocerol synthesis polyketide synthase type I Pks15/1 domain protein [Mycobacterium ulcerans str. Harvey]
MVFPGTGFVELAIRAGDEVGCSVVNELTLRTPLVLPASGSVAVQVVVGAAADSAERSVSIYSRTDTDTDAGSVWVCHAEGTLGADSAQPAADLSAWPPAGAIAVDVADGYERLDARGYGYGPAFRGLTAMWARGEELFAEARLPEAAGSTSGFGVHPALLDAALHTAVIANPDADLVLPFSWQGVSLHAAGPRRCGYGSRRLALVGLGGTRRRPWSAGAFGQGDGGPPGKRAADARRGVRIRSRPAVRGGLDADDGCRHRCGTRL